MKHVEFFLYNLHARLRFRVCEKLCKCRRKLCHRHLWHSKLSSPLTHSPNNPNQTSRQIIQLNSWYANRYSRSLNYMWYNAMIQTCKMYVKCHNNRATRMIAGNYYSGVALLKCRRRKKKTLFVISLLLDMEFFPLVWGLENCWTIAYGVSAFSPPFVFCFMLRLLFFVLLPGASPEPECKHRSSSENVCEIGYEENQTQEVNRKINSFFSWLARLSFRFFASPKARKKNKSSVASIK